ncbi:angiotensin-converting enzyme-like [Frankliniella occidentalis]|uniref:Angiotensin-converting enzyme n=1 Tax=Frankliniella occidentalis TaxID=133901 RepID=A0A9C6UBV4_FRAOC|nr:angiotensin-converting enzyme-like [Frankliniella occidentalis]
MRVAVVLLAVLCIGGATARCLRGGVDRLGRVSVVSARPARSAPNATASVGKDAAITELKLRQYLAAEYEQQATYHCNKVNEADWNYNVDLLNPDTTAKKNAATSAMASFTRKSWEVYFKDLDASKIKDSQLRRQVHFLQSLGTAALSDEEFQQLNTHLNSMQTTYGTAKVCPYTNQQCALETEGLDLDPGVEEIITTSQDYDELTYIWKAWHDASGKKMRSDYKEYVALSNKAATANGFADMGAMWQGTYEVDEFQKTIDELWAEVQPLYAALHKYTLNKLRGRYPDHIGANDTLIPGHILGNMWGQTWINLYDLLKPYPNASSYDVTNALRQQAFDAKKMFKYADDFYQSMGLLSNEMCYGPKAMIEKPVGREVTCHASAWDFCDGQDFRIKMCTKINQDDFRTIHHEMGHIQYYQQYAHLPYVLRDGANPGFHEAIGDTIALSVDTPKHLETVKLLTGYDDTKESRINALMKMALEKVAFLPFGLLVDLWRWDVFAGRVKESEWNKHWWDLKAKYQLVSPPVTRSEDDFDPGAKYHVPADSKYISYFLANILQFQFYRALCIEAGQYTPDDPKSEPLHACDFFESKAAGAKLAAGLSLGASVHWKDTLLVMTNGTEMNGKALLEYFAPLYEFLLEANGDKPGTSGTSSATGFLVLSVLAPVGLMLLVR